MSSDPRRARGAHGEGVAAAHLAAAGYRILERNFRTRYGELDLIALDERALVFCEVKTRRAGGRAGPAHPLEAVGADKRRRVRLMARQWLAERSAGEGRPWRPLVRFDAVGVTLERDGTVAGVEHVEDAF